VFTTLLKLGFAPLGVFSAMRTLNWACILLQRALALWLLLLFLDITF
jgi:hypothetical protein